MILGASPIEGELIVRAIVATGLGSVVGLERSFRYKDAGLRTLALVALGSCAFATAGFSVLSLPGLGQTRPDPTRIAAQVVSGVGFLGAGAIFVSGGQRIRGLTTAADIWVAAASGVLCGVGLLLTAVAVTALGLGVVICFAPAADWLRKREAKAKRLTPPDDDSDLS
jgi:putative Mg2+ transporter-C (MgtC) family protein